MHCTCLVFLCSQCVSVNVHACLATQQRRLLNHNLVVGLILEQCQIIYVVMCRHKHKALKGFHPIVRSAGHPSSYLTVCVVWSCVYVAFCLCLVLPARLQPDSVIFYIFSCTFAFHFLPFHPSLFSEYLSVLLFMWFLLETLSAGTLHLHTQHGLHFQSAGLYAG